MLLFIVGAVSIGCAKKESNFPQKPIHMIVTFPPGGGNDIIARAFAKAMEKHISQPVVVDNISGAGGLTGTLETVKAKPDGYTILLQDASLTGMMAYQDNLPFSLDNLEPLCSVYTNPTWILTPKDRNYKTLQDFLDAAKKKPGQLSVGVAVSTGSQYLMAEAIKGYLGLDYKIIPYNGGGPLKVALLGNQVDIGIIHSPMMLPEVKEGMINVLAAGSSMQGIHYDKLKNIPTLKDLNIPFTFTSTRGFLVPKGTPPETKKFLEDLIKKASDGATIKEFAKTFEWDPTWQDHEAYGKFLKDELAQYKEIIKKYVKK
ncbi:MAG: tripartite tricarboxylate transporter substrate binding protein [Firmicutes bacterium]|nr:tripartite tricarboxylate transporter substrate binding protein [Bacillota bacterium]